MENEIKTAFFDKTYRIAVNTHRYKAVSCTIPSMCEQEFDQTKISMPIPYLYNANDAMALNFK